MKKRLLPTLLACLTALALLPLTAFATEPGWVDCEERFHCWIEPEQHTAVVCGRAAGNTDSEITIPATVTYGDDEYTVTGIEDGAFKFDSNITSLTVAEGITSIGGSAFIGCEKLAEITLPDSVTSVSRDSFQDTAYFDDDEKWENDVLYIGKCLIAGRNNVRACVVKDGTVAIADKAFEASEYAKDLTSVTIPASVVTIGGTAFRNCGGLKTVSFAENSCLKTIGAGAFCVCSSLSSIDLPDSIESIEDETFRNTGLTSVVLPEGLKVIRGSLFKDCGRLTEVTIPSTVTEIWNGAFDGCNNLETIHFGGSPAQWAAITGYGTPLPSPKDYYNRHSITVKKGDADVTIRPRAAATGETVTVTCALHPGCEYGSVTVTGPGDTVIAQTPILDDTPGVRKFSFTMPEGDVKVEVKTKLIVEVPTVNTLTYNGKAQTGVPAGTDYTLSGTTSATNAGSYTAKATLKTDANYVYTWSDGTTAAKTINWKINKAAAKVTAPTGKTLTYNGKTQTGVASGAKYTLSGTVKAVKAGSYTAKAALKTDANYTYKWSDGATAAKTVNWKISPASLKDKKLVLAKTAYPWNGKVQKPTVKTVGGKALKSGTDYTVKYSNASSKAVGSYTVTVTGKGNYTGTSAKAAYKINKAANPLTVKAATATVKYSALKTANQTLGVTKVITFSKKGQGTMTYSKTSGNAKITINKTTGKITVKKGLAKGTYKVKLTAKAAGNANYKASAVKSVTSTIVVK